MPSFNITSSDSIFDVKIGSSFTNALPGFIKQNNALGATIIGINRAPDKFVGAGSLTVAQNNWDPSSNNINYE